ncbi:MAG TPA: RNA polymerase factor sigma-54 [Syntrophomonadaceae bacterium]|nr:RNA polymerase factor sigma-54 [Syntrophomonadaceae bacterium]HRX21673.1 RNA polymerase factor sigma-54 [Syntrophomonadaceae bacterium]
MRLTPDIFLQQQQKLLMTPELRQAIAILQMSSLELNDYVQQELESNPLLEENTEEPEPFDNSESSEDNLNSELYKQWLEYYDERGSVYAERENEEQKSYENIMSRRPGLYEYLETEIHLALADQQSIAIGEYLIGNIDNNGYLSVSLEEVSRYCNVSVEEVEKVLNIVQCVAPAGIGARDLAESLKLQLQSYGKQSEAANRIIDHYLEEVAKGKLNKIARELNIPVQQVQEICDLIRSLDPKPGLQFSNNNEIKYIVPDIFVEKIEGQYIVIVNDFQYGRLTVNNTYQKILRQPESFSEDTKKYLEEKLSSALWLIRSIEQRRMTLYKVARCIVDIQTEFLDHGVEYLKPLTLRQVADLVEVHESTVSRATANKYIQTPQGLLEMKYFFSTAVKCYGQSEVSSKSIKFALEEIIQQEDTSNPLSDENIAKQLEDRGIKISRRTIAKYRQELNIPPAMSRKRY